GRRPAGFGMPPPLVYMPCSRIFASPRKHRHESAAMQGSGSFPRLPAPVAERRRHVDTRHGVERIDDYAWLRAGNWQDVFKDPSALAADIGAHLQAENRHQQALM